MSTSCLHAIRCLVSEIVQFCAHGQDLCLMASLSGTVIQDCEFLQFFSRVFKVRFRSLAVAAGC